jgi:prevent-host-death family protein
MINIHEAKTNLSKIIEKVERTKQPAIIARHGKPVVRIIPLEVISKKSLAGALKDKIIYSDQFDLSDKEIEKLFQ